MCIRGSGSGILKGCGLGKNVQAMMIARGLHEMIHFGRALGSDNRAFFGTPGVGDLIATATSSKLSLIHISEPTRQAEILYAVFCLKKKKNKTQNINRP